MGVNDGLMAIEVHLKCRYNRKNEVLGGGRLW